MTESSSVPTVSARFSALPAGFSAWLWDEPRSAPGGPENGVRAVLRVLFIAAREFGCNRIPLRASALTFTVILSLVPLLALGTAVLKGVGAGGHMRQTAHGLISLMGEGGAAVARPASPASPGQATGAVQPLAPPDSLGDHLHLVADTVFDYADRTSFATMGLVGVLVLLFTVYTLLGSIERTFNVIWQAGGSRTFGRKLVDYLALLVLLPLSVNLGVAAMAALKSPRLLSHLQQWLPWLGSASLNLLPAAAMVATFSILYGFLPNTRVSGRAALAGGLFGGLLWLFLQAIYFKLQIVVVRYNAIYGSFAALPLFLLWIYLSWTVFLLGAEVSFAFQVRRHYRWRQAELAPVGRLALAFEILAATAEDHREKRLTTADGLARRCKQPEPCIEELLRLLCGAGFLRRVEDGEGGFLPAAPLQELSAAEVAGLVLGEVPAGVPDDNPAHLALAAMHDSLAGDRFSILDRQKRIGMRCIIK